MPSKFSKTKGCIPIILLTLLLYFLTLSRNYSSDSILYAIDIESGSLSRLVDHYHLLLHPLGWVFYQLWRAFGWSGNALLPLQVLNAFGGAASVGLIFAIVRRVTDSEKVAWVVAAGFALSGGTWLMSTNAEFVTIPLATALLVLYLLLSAAPEQFFNKRYAILLALATALAILCYLTNAFLVLVALVAFLTLPKISPTVRRRQLVLYLATLAMICLPPLLLVITWLSRGDFVNLAYLFGSGLYGELTWFNLPHGGYAFLRSLALYPKLGNNARTSDFLAAASSFQRTSFAVYYAAILMIAALPLFLSFLHRKQLWDTYRRSLIILGSWTLLYAAFAFWWVPGDLSFWISVLAAWWLLVGLVLSVSRFDPITESKTKVGKYQILFVAAFSLFLFAANAGFVILPEHDLSRNHAYRIASEIREITNSDDLILTDWNDVLTLYVIYFAEREVIPVFFNQGEGVQKEILNYLDQQISFRFRSNDRVFAAGFDRPLSDFLAKYTLTPISNVSAGTIWEIKP